MWMIILYFLHHVILLTRFENMSPKRQNLHFSLEHRNLTKFHFWMSKFVLKIINLLSSVYRNQHLVEFAPIANVSFQHSKKDARHYIEISTYRKISLIRPDMYIWTKGKFDGPIFGGGGGGLYLGGKTLKFTIC